MLLLKGIKGMVKTLEFIGSILRDTFSLVLLGLGITFAPHMYIGGLFLALAGATIARAYTYDQLLRNGDTPQREGNVKLTLVIVTAFLVSTLTASAVHSFWPDWSVQLVMATSGFASRWIVVILISILINLSGRGSIIADRLISRYFPEEKGNNRG